MITLDMIARRMMRCIAAYVNEMQKLRLAMWNGLVEELNCGNFRHVDVQSGLGAALFNTSG